MKKPQITKLLGWDALNKGAILVTLATGIPAILSFIGAQSLATILLLAVSSISLTIALYRAYRIKANLRTKDALVKHLLDHGKNITRDIHSIRIETGSNQKVDQESIIKLEQEALSRVVRSLSESISSITGEKMEVGIKLLTKDDDDDNFVAGTFVSTYSSDRASSIKHEIPVRNTFLSRAMSESRTILINNISREPNYIDQNPKWEHYYQSCAVTPIATRTEGNQVEQLWYGFLVVDSKKQNVFTDEVLPVMEFYADWSSLLLSQMYMLSVAEPGA